MAAHADGPVLTRVAERAGIVAALTTSGIEAPRAVVVLVGGAGGLQGTAVDALAALLRDAVVPAVVAHGATVLDGGTDSGVMRLIGRARSALDATFPLVGVAAEGTVVLPGAAPGRADAADLEAHHTHVLLVPGHEWGDEAPWISDVATAIAADRPSVTVLVNGGRIAYEDAARSLAAGRPLVVVAGSGRTADVIAEAHATGDGDAPATRIAASPLTTIAHLDDLGEVAAAIGAGLAAVVGRP